MKTYVALDFKSGLADPSLAQFTANILARVKTNSRFAPLLPLVDTGLQPAYDRFMVSLQEAADGSRTKIAEKRLHRQRLIDILEEAAALVLTLPDNSESLILESGFQPRRRVIRPTAPEQVLGLRARAGDQPGEVRLDFQRVPQARLYGIEWSNDAGLHWNNGAYASATHAVVTGLPNRQDLWFRVSAIGTQQRKGAPSAVTQVFVP